MVGLHPPLDLHSRVFAGDEMRERERETAVPFINNGAIPAVSSSVNIQVKCSGLCAFAIRL